MGLLTADEVDAGYKDVEVVTRDGRKRTVRLVAIPARQSDLLLKRMLIEKDDLVPLLASMTSLQSDSENLLDKLDVESITSLKGVAFALNFGESFKKKWTETAVNHARMNMQSAAPNLASSAADSVPLKSEAGASPN